MKEFAKSMTDELSPVKSLEVIIDGKAEEISGASSFVMFLDEDNIINLKVLFDLESMNKSFVAIKMASSNKMDFHLVAECGMELNFTATTYNIGRNYTSFKMKKKSIIDTF